MAESVIIVGGSTRAAKASAERAGFTPLCVEVDHPAQAPGRIEAKAGHLPEALFMYGAPLDRDPAVIDALAFDRKPRGCSGEALRALHDPTVLASVPMMRGLKLPRVRSSLSLGRRLARLMLGSLGRTRYLRKPIPGRGGHDITWWGVGSEARSIGRGHYLQQHVKGIALTAVFDSDGWSSALIGVADQLVGEPALGAGPFQVCGSVGPSRLSDTGRTALSHLGVVLTQRHDLRGLFSVDLVMDFKGDLWPVDVDPRYPQAVEVLERATGVASLNRGASSTKYRRQSGGGTSGDPSGAGGGSVHGKATVRAKASGVMPDLGRALPEGAFADAAPPGAPLTAGQCICTVFARAPGRDACVQKLGKLARQVYAAGAKADAKTKARPQDSG